jgi:hypothetical protein
MHSARAASLREEELAAPWKRQGAYCGWTYDRDSAWFAGYYPKEWSRRYIEFHFVSDAPGREWSLGSPEARRGLLQSARSFSHLETLSFPNTDFGDDDAEHLAWGPALKELYVTHTRITPKGIRVLLTRPHLQVLYATLTQLGDLDSLATVSRETEVRVHLSDWDRTLFTRDQVIAFSARSSKVKFAVPSP